MTYLFQKESRKTNPTVGDHQMTSTVAGIAVAAAATAVSYKKEEAMLQC